MRSATDETGHEVTADNLWDIFRSTYLATPADASVELVGVVTDDRSTTITIRAYGRETTTSHDGVGPVEALTAALADIGSTVEILGFHQTSTGAGDDSTAMTLVEYRNYQQAGWAAGTDRSVLTASLTAVMNAATAGAGTLGSRRPRRSPDSVIQ